MLQLAEGDFYRIDYVGMRRWGERALGVAEELDELFHAASLAVIAVCRLSHGPASPRPRP